TVYSTQHKVRGEDGPVPIGRPISNTQLYIMDPHGKPVPVGVAGELHIGGGGLARGYLNRSELTNEKFIPSPFVPGERLYRTGDLVRYLAGGEVQFLGRIDDQVKIRGFRIELGEIEAVLAQHADVRQAVVVAREHQPGDLRLVAYVVPAAGEGGADELIPRLRSHLRAALPEYMVPWAFVPLERLPLTPSGKVDRGALPAPEQGRMALEQAYAAPATETEQALAGIWEQVLGVPRVGVNDNFFSLGGHSLLATVLISRVRDALAVELPLRSLFENATVAELARRIDAELHHGSGVRTAPINIGKRSGPLPLSHAQERLWFLDQLEPGSTAYHMPAAVRLDGRLAVGALQESLNEVVRRHESLRTTFSATGGRPEQRIAPFMPIVLPVHDLSGEAEGEREAVVRRTAADEASRPFDLETGPLLRTGLLRLSETEHVLLVTMHHIISDGWSIGVFIREVSALYDALVADQPSPLPELPVQYADFAVWQRDWLQGAVLEQQLGYWREQLGGSPALQLPTDRPRPPVPSRRGASQNFMLPQSLAEGLNAVSRQEGATLFMTLLAAFQALLARYTGQADIAVGTAIANRTRAEVEGLIGFFANTLVLRTDLAGNPTFRELLARVRNVTLGAYANQDLPFEQVVDAVQPNRDLSLSPLFQVMLILLNTPPASMALQGLTLTPIELEAQAARLDLVLTATEQRDGLVLSVEYSTDLFEPSTIARMMSHFETLLAGVVRNPEGRVAEVPFMSEGERDELLVAWNDTATDRPADCCVTDLVEAQAARTPDRVAVAYDGETLTYHELNQRANQLAHYLRKHGVGPEVLVGVFVERSLAMIIALQGILKAGGAYVPLDPAYPRERLAFMLADAQPPILITQQPLAGQLPDHDSRLI
ncbi:MAG: non-ribosomal peptide synthetase, partial [Firmicutes bacterium]|nr:non-ribosomal peptide synthetase [Bacillota bacterium]